VLYIYRLYLLLNLLNFQIMGIRDVVVYGIDGKQIPLATLVMMFENDRIDNFREV